MGKDSYPIPTIVLPRVDDNEDKVLGDHNSVCTQTYNEQRRHNTEKLG